MGKYTGFSCPSTSATGVFSCSNGFEAPNLSPSTYTILVNGQQVFDVGVIEFDGTILIKGNAGCIPEKITFSLTSNGPITQTISIDSSCDDNGELIFNNDYGAFEFV